MPTPYTERTLQNPLPQRSRYRPGGRAFLCGAFFGGFVREAGSDAVLQVDRLLRYILLRLSTDRDSKFVEGPGTADFVLNVFRVVVGFGPSFFSVHWRAEPVPAVRFVSAVCVGAGPQRPICRADPVDWWCRPWQAVTFRS